MIVTKRLINMVNEIWIELLIIMINIFIGQTGAMISIMKVEG